MNIIFNNNTNYNNIIYQEIKGGLGNQLAIIFNLIVLSSKYNKYFAVHFNNNYVKRPNFQNYSFFKYIQDSNQLNKNKKILFKKYNQKMHIYKLIRLDKNKNYILNGYFLSYKHWWNYKNKIKKIIYINNDKIKKIKNLYLSFKKKILTIHIRLDDYLKNPDLFLIQKLDYYKKALSFYNLNKYKILLFSDNINKAKEILKPLNLNYEVADNYYKNDEDQFYMLMLSNVRICSNSTYSLMNCYLNEIYQWIPKAIYIFPSEWYNKKKFYYKINDFMIHNRFISINTKNISFDKKYDVLTTLHKKDLQNYENFFNTNMKFLDESSNFYYIANENFNIKSNFINENKFPFSKKDIQNYLKDYIPKDRCGWYYQQLLKLYIFKIENNFKKYVLILDGDLIFFNYINFFKNNRPKINYLDLGNKKIHQPYISTINYLFPNIKIDPNKSGICHFILFKKNILNEILYNIENKFNKLPWKAILDSVIYYVKKNKYNISIFSEYELYYNYVINFKNNIYELNKFNDNFIDTNINNFNWINKNNKLKFIGNHSWIKK